MALAVALAAAAAGLPANMRVNWESLYRHKDMLTALVAANLLGPAFVVAEDLLVRVFVTVSVVFAVA